LGESSPRKTTLVPRSKYLLVLALVALFLGSLQLSHSVQIPFGQLFSGVGGSIFSLSSLTDYMTKYGYASLFGLMALESASTPVPSEVVLPFAGYLVYIGVMNFWVAVTVSTVASLVGALLDYFLAFWLGRPFVVRMLRIFRLGPGPLDRAERWFQRSGQWTVFVARFVPGLRTVISLPAGLFEMPIWSFVAMTAAGCFAWSIILIYAGFLAAKGGGAVTNAFASSSTVVDGLSALVAGLSVAYIAYFAYGSRGPGRAVSPQTLGS
jgi:membrane protein DedA with SNARE-associated domain